MLKLWGRLLSIYYVYMRMCIYVVCVGWWPQTHIQMHCRLNITAARAAEFIGEQHAIGFQNMRIAFASLPLTMRHTKYVSMLCISRIQNKTICSPDRTKGVNVRRLIFTIVYQFSLHFNGAFQF